MDKYKINTLIEYLSLILVLSFLFLKNIYIVFIGITIALYRLNLNFLDRFIIKYLIKKKDTEATVIEKNLNENQDDNNSNNENKNLSLVETIEETGFIPSSINKEESHAA